MYACSVIILLHVHRDGQEVHRWCCAQCWGVRLMVSGVWREGWRAGATAAYWANTEKTLWSTFYVSLQITLLSTFIFTYIARIPILMEHILQIRFFKFLNLKKVKLKKDFLKHTELRIAHFVMLRRYQNYNWACIQRVIMKSAKNIVKIIYKTLS